MSNRMVIATEFKNFKTLEKAAKGLGYRLTGARTLYGQKCDETFSRGSNDVFGVKKSGSTYQVLVNDFYGHGIVENLKREYAKIETTRLATEQGYQVVNRGVDKNGDQVIEIMVNE